MPKQSKSGSSISKRSSYKGKSGKSSKKTTTKIKSKGKNTKEEYASIMSSILDLSKKEEKRIISVIKEGYGHEGESIHFHSFTPEYDLDPADNGHATWSNFDGDGIIGIFLGIYVDLGSAGSEFKHYLVDSIEEEFPEEW